ncbi:DUF3921 family protein [Metabacillus iocasae]|uniref:Cell division FtsZ-interacting protein ZapD n=1 Tax=Priestia iocasae TaxID=2291674 RepID=A0ABS2QVG8_9BACI|nr:DUF3921 family protein [Metabacillus iocasae]MBM7703268.1 cell division FtsZ-interacting protein ZapD [Metabacillus iocasae]
MTYNQIDFERIHHALENSYELLQKQNDVATNTLSELEKAKQEYKSAWSFATSIDERYISYTTPNIEEL